jgi:CubicO group peptidase (beta-lactamase class C family)
MFERIDPALVGFSGDRLERISQWLEEQTSGSRLAGASALVARHGKVAYLGAAGYAETSTGQPFEEETIVRLYSMTKPVTTVAAMMLYEEGHFQLDDPVAKYLPAFANTPVWTGGDAPLTSVVDQTQPILVKHLMNHTSGLTYGFMHSNVVDAAYREHGLEFGAQQVGLRALVDQLAEIPLLCQPGSRWNYSVAMDVLGCLVEIWSGMTLESFFAQRIFQPMGMQDTGFHVPQAQRHRFAALYAPAEGGGLSGIASGSSYLEQSQRGGLKLEEAVEDSPYFLPAITFSGGGGLVGTLGDYACFCQMLLNGGEFQGERLLSPKTIAYMRTNQLPEGGDMASMGQPVWSETSYEGIGFGLGFAVVIDPPKASIIASKGEHHWGGVASTFFWIDPEEDLFVVFLTQLMPSSTYPIRRELRVRVYQALLE